MGGSKSSLLLGLKTASLFITTSLFSQPVFDKVYLPSQVTIPQKIYFSGSVKDDEGLHQITLIITGPAGSNIRAYSESLSGHSRDLSNFWFHSGHHINANLPGNYTVTLIVRNRVDRTTTRNFDVEVIQDKVRAEIKRKIEFEHLTQQDGLSSDLVYEIFQDSRGFIWFGTKNGLNRYDGYGFKHYFANPEDSTSIRGNYVWSIIEDHDGTLWVGTTRGLNKFDRWRERFSHYKHNERDSTSLSNSYVRVIYEDSQNRLWVGTINGLNMFDPKQESFDRHNMNPDNPRQNGPNYILSICEDLQGTIWVGTFQGLFVFDEVTNKLTMPRPWRESKYKDVAVPALWLDQKGILWIGTWGQGLLMREPTGSHFHGPSETTPPNLYAASSILIDKSGDIWATNSTGLLKYSPQQNLLVQWKHDSRDPKSLRSNDVRTIYQDRAGTIWVGTIGGGISQVKGKRFQTLLQDGPNPASRQISAIHRFNDKVWAGTWGGGLYEFDPIGMTKPNRISSFPKANIHTIVVDSSNTPWVGGAYAGGGLNRYIPEEDKFKRYLRKSDHSTVTNEISYILADDDVTALLTDRSGNLWIGTALGGLHKYIPPENEFIRYQYNPSDTASLSSNTVLALLQDHNGILWVGTVAGLDKFDRSTTRFLRYKAEDGNSNSLSDVGVTDLHEYPDGILWIGTASGGLNRFDIENETFRHYRKNDGWPSDLVFGMTHDSDGNLWIASDRGLVRYNWKTERFRVFGAADGLPSENMFGPSFKDNDGTLFFGTNNGLFYFHPDSLKDNTFVPPVVLTDFKIFYKNVGLDTLISAKKQIKLTHEQNVLSFEFAALNFINSEKNQYKYKLEGLDDDWIDAGTRRFATYTNLDPGDYLFRVQGSNNDGLWNEEGASVRITITPPPWRTWWAYTLYVIFVVGSLLAVRRYELTRQRLRMDREKLAELDRTKSRFFANISHEFRTPLTLILGPLQSLMQGRLQREEQKQYKVMERNAHRLLRLINQLLDLSRLEAGKLQLEAEATALVAFLRGLVFSFESLAKQKEITLHFSTGLEGKGNEPLVVYLDHDKMEKVVTNLLSNAFKFTPPGGRISVSLSHRDGIAEIVVQDTGIGIAPEALPHIFDRFYQAGESYRKDQPGSGIGLALTKEFVELHQGQIKVSSELEKGTKFTVLVPLGREHLSSEQIVESESGKGRSQAKEESISITTSEGRSEVAIPHETDRQQATSSSLPEHNSGIDDSTIVLVIEDNDDMRNYIRDQLGSHFRVVEAVDGKAGLVQAVADVPDLVISDVMMPVMDGYELCKELKLDERTSHIPVILLTAKSSGESKIEGLELGADDYLIKPFDSKELLARVGNLIEQRRKLRERWTKVVKLEPKKIAITSADERFLQRAMDIVNGELDKAESEETPDFTVEGLAERVGMSRVQLHRKLTALTDQSATDFVRSLRLQRSAQLLRANFDNVSRVAYAVGFENLSYFSKIFKEHFGALPSEYSGQAYDPNS